MVSDLFGITAQKIAEHFEYQYPYRDDERVTANLKNVRELPRDSEEMY